MERGRKVIVAEDEPHYIKAIRAMLEGSGHEIVAVATTREVALQVIGEAGVSGADLLLLDGNLRPPPGHEPEEGDGADARAILEAITKARRAGTSGTFNGAVVAISGFPMSEYSITEGVTRDIGKGGIPDLPDVIAGL